MNTHEKATVAGAVVVLIGMICMLPAFGLALWFVVMLAQSCAGR